jgi:hypothetical protein
VDALTKPTRGRVLLWCGLALVWLLFLPQDLAMDHGHHHFSWVGAALWACVLAWLLFMAHRTQRRRNPRT